MRIAIAARAIVLAAGWLLASAVCSDVLAQPFSPGERYFVDFRARSSAHIGHTYIVYFRVDPGGRVIDQHLAGLVPEEDVWNGVFSPIRAKIRKYKDDSRLPATVIYRRELSAREFDRVDRAVHSLEASQHQWHLIFYNCNDFANQIAETLGLPHPPSLLPPSVWVGMFKLINER